jgi:hypothetical protein
LWSGHLLNQFSDERQEVNNLGFAYRWRDDYALDLAYDLMIHVNAPI